MMAIRTFSSPVRLRPKLVHPASGWLVLLLLLPVGLAGQETEQVTLYTPDGSQQRTLSTPLVVDVGLPSPMEAPVSAVVGTGTGMRVTDVEVVVSDSAGGKVTTEMLCGWMDFVLGGGCVGPCVGGNVGGSEPVRRLAVDDLYPSGRRDLRAGGGWSGAGVGGAQVWEGAFSLRRPALDPLLV